MVDKLCTLIKLLKIRDEISSLSISHLFLTVRHVSVERLVKLNKWWPARRVWGWVDDTWRTVREKGWGYLIPENAPSIMMSKAIKLLNADKRISTAEYKGVCIIAPLILDFFAYLMTICKGRGLTVVLYLKNCMCLREKQREKLIIYLGHEILWLK